MELGTYIFILYLNGSVKRRFMELKIDYSVLKFG